MGTIKYNLGEGSVALREAKYNICFEANKSISIVFNKLEELEGTPILSIRRQSDFRINKIIGLENGAFIIPADWVIEGSKILMDIAVLNERDEIVRSWLCEPIDIVSYTDKIKNTLSLMHDDAELFKRLDKLEAQAQALSSLKERVCEVERLIGILAEVTI